MSFENNRAVCDKCYKGNYLNRDRTCSGCHLRDITGGICKISSVNPTDYATGECRCDSIIL